jgi:tetratricopeptide (TPR) repeat protein
MIIILNLENCRLKYIKYTLIIPFLLFSAVLIGQSNTNKFYKNRWTRYSNNIENSIEELNQGQFYGGDWKVSKHRTKGDFTWVQFEIFWTDEDKGKVGFIAESTIELEEICLNIENLYLNESKVKKRGTKKIDGILFLPFNSYFIVDFSFSFKGIAPEKELKNLKDFSLKGFLKEGFESFYNKTEGKSWIDKIYGKKLNKIEAAEFVQLLRKQYHLFKGFKQNRKCNSVRFSALGLFKDKNFALTVEEYELYMAMNCIKLTFQMASQYGNSLVNLNKYNSAVNFYKAIDDKIIYCENCGNLGSFYFKSAKIKHKYLNDYEGALADLDTAISLNKTGARFWVRSLVYEKMDMLEKAKKDKLKAYQLDSLYYVKEINKNIKDLSFYKISPINGAKAARDFRLNADYHKKLKMFAASKEDSINAMKYDTVYVKYNIEKINKVITAHYKLRKKKRKASKQNLSYSIAKRAKYYKQIGLYEKAFNDYKKIIELSPEVPFYNIELSKYYLRNNNFVKALEIVNKTISLKEYPDFKKIQLNNLKGIILLKLHKVEDACQLYKEMSVLKMYKEMVTSNFISGKLKSSCEAIK